MSPPGSDDDWAIICKRSVADGARRGHDPALQWIFRFDDRSAVQIRDPVPQSFPQHSVLGLAGAVAGKIPGGTGGQLPGSFGQLPALGLHFDEVEAAKEHIGPEPVQDIQQALVGAAAEAVFSVVCFQQQVLLMEVGIVGMDTVFTDTLAKDTEGEGPQQIIAGAQGDARPDLQHILHRDQPGMVFQCRVQTNVPAAAEMFPEGMAAEIHRGVVIFCQEPCQASAVVIVAVGQDAEIHGIQVDAQLFRIVRKGTGLACIEEDGVAAGFDQQAQAVLGGQILPAGGVFNENGDLHGITSDQDAVAVVDLMLDDLGGPAGEGLDPGLEGLILPADLDLLKPLCFPGAAQQGQTALLSLIVTGGREDLRIQHHQVAALTVEGNDAFGHADHVGSHADAGIFVGSQGIQQIPGGIQIFSAGGSGLSGQQEGVMNKGTDHRQFSFCTGVDGARRIHISALLQDSKKAGRKAAQQI